MTAKGFIHIFLPYQMQRLSLGGGRREGKQTLLSEDVHSIGLCGGNELILRSSGLPRE